MVEIDHMHQELAEFIDALGQGHGLGMELSVIDKQMRVVQAHHAAARTRGHDHGPRFGKQIELVQGHGARFVRVAAAVGGLAATGLLLQVMHRDALALEQPHGIEPGLGRELVHETGREKINVLGFGRVRSSEGAVCAHGISSF